MSWKNSIKIEKKSVSKLSEISILLHSKETSQCTVKWTIVSDYSNQNLIHFWRGQSAFCDIFRRSRWLLYCHFFAPEDNAFSLHGEQSLFVQWKTIKLIWILKLKCKICIQNLFSSICQLLLAITHRTNCTGTMKYDKWQIFWWSKGTDITTVVMRKSGIFHVWQNISFVSFLIQFYSVRNCIDNLIQIFS